MAGIVLPVTRGDGGAPQRRGIQLPTAENVPQVKQVADPGVTVPAGAFDNGGAALAKAGAEIGTAAERYMSRVRLEAEKQQADYDYAQTGEAELGLKQKYGQALYDSNGDDWASLDTLNSRSKEADDWAAEATAGLKSDVSPKARERATLAYGQLALTQKTAYQKQHLIAGDAASEDVANKSTNMFAAQARQNPYDVDTVMTQGTQDLEQLSGSLNANKRRDLTATRQASVLTGSILGMIDKKDFSTPRAMLADERYNTVLSLGQRDSLMSQVDVAQRTAGNEVKSQFRDHIASIEATGIGIPGYMAKAEAAGVTGVQLDVMKREQVSAARFYQATQVIGTQTPAGMIATVNGLKPTPGSVGFADGQNRYEQAQRAVAVELQRRQEDSAAAVAGDPRVQQAAQAASTNPAATSTYAMTVLAAQEARDIPATDRRVLTKPQASQIVATSFAGNPEKWADTIDGMRNQYGDAWPVVWRDLTKAKMPVEAQIFGTLSTKVADGHGGFQETVLPGDAIVRKDFGAALQATRKTLEANLVTGDKGKIDAAVATNMNDWATAELARGGAEANVQAMRSAGEMLAYQYRSKGMDPEAAGKKAADDLVNGRHDLVNGNNFNLYVHKGQGAAVEFTGRKILGTLDPQNIPDPGGDPSLTAEQRKANYAESVKNGGTWVLSADGHKAVLLDPVGTPVTKFGPDNFQAAVNDMKLTPQEQNLYQMHLANLKKGGVKNPDGSTSTLFQASTEMDGRTYNFPTVWNGRILPPALAAKEAAKKGWDFWPSYKTEAEAEARYTTMHDYMERDLIAAPVQFSIDDAKEPTLAERTQMPAPVVQDIKRGDITLPTFGPSFGNKPLPRDAPKFP